MVGLCFCLVCALFIHLNLCSRATHSLTKNVALLKKAGVILAEFRWLVNMGSGIARRREQARTIKSHNMAAMFQLTGHSDL